jgi:DNA-binding winged helix-turn-helix (wHTH) protein
MSFHAATPEKRTFSAPPSGRSAMVERTWTPSTYLFGPFTFQPERQLLLKQQSPVRIGGRAIDILTALVRCPGDLVSKQELVDWVWPKIFVDESNLKANVAALRRALEDRPVDPLYIATVIGRGYRFVGMLRVRG